MEKKAASPWNEVDENAADADAAGKPSVQRWMVLSVVTLAIFARGRAAEDLQLLNRDPDGYRDIAEGLARHGVYGLFRYTSQPSPTAFRPPLYPLLLAPLIRLGQGLPLAVAFIHLVLGGLTVWLVWRLACRWGVPPRAALLAATLIAIDPILINRSGQIMTETLATLLAVVALYALTAFSESPTARRAGVAGASLGLCVLCHPTFIVWLACVVAIIPLVLRRQRSWSTRLSQASACLVGAAILLAPWAIRNQFRFGLPIVTTTCGGSTLLVGNNASFYDYARTASWGSVWDSRKFDRSWQKTSQKVSGEVARDRLAYSLAWRNIRRQPTMFLLGCGVRVGWLWGLVPHQTNPFEGHGGRFVRYATGVWYGLEFLLAAIGLRAMGKRITVVPWLWGVLLVVSFTAVHTLYWSNLAMRAPLMPVLAMLAALGARVLWTERPSIKLFS